MHDALGLLYAHSEIVTLVLTVLVIALLVWSILLFRRVSRLMRRRSSVLADAQTGDIVDAIEALVARADGVDSDMRGLRADFQRHEMVLDTCIKHVGAIRFDAFDDVGGEQSFAVALLDSHGDGMALSVIYGRQDSRVYSKSIKAGKSDRTLSGEEQRAIDIAMSSDAIHATAAR
jgi:hypothetical protein